MSPKSWHRELPMNSNIRRINLADVRTLRVEVGDTVTERAVATFADDAEPNERPMHSDGAVRMLAAAIRYLSNRNVRMQVELQLVNKSRNHAVAGEDVQGGPRVRLQSESLSDM